ncbi:MAG TPA: rhomboid family intramembrane serine protease [Gammaproteobacteria bacterium]|nr:rhomboid family intramembrane serine protease [Gammaproteobacteria bacterium]
MIPLRDDNPTELRPVVTVAVIALCVLAYLWQLSLPPRSEQALVYSLGLIPSVLLGHRELEEGLKLVPAPVTILTSMFLHGGFLHLAGNMLYLWIFGDNVEDRMGHGRFTAFYLLCGLAAALSQALPDPESVLPMIGASGAISGVLGAYLLLYPRASVLVIIPIFIIPYTLRLPALLVLGAWFVGQLLSSLAAPGAGGGVAFRAHIGGFLAGVLLVRLFARRTPALRPRW